MTRSQVSVEKETIGTLGGSMIDVGIILGNFRCSVTRPTVLRCYNRADLRQGPAEGLQLQLRFEIQPLQHLAKNLQQNPWVRCRRQ